MAAQDGSFRTLGESSVSVARPLAGGINLCKDSSFILVRSVTHKKGEFLGVGGD